MDYFIAMPVEVRILLDFLLGSHGWQRSRTESELEVSILLGVGAGPPRLGELHRGGGL